MPRANPVVLYKGIGPMTRGCRTESYDAANRSPKYPLSRSDGKRSFGARRMPERGTTGTPNRQLSFIRARRGG